MQNSTPNFQVAPQYDKVMWPFVNCERMGGSGRYRVSAEVTDPSRSQLPSIPQITQSRPFPNKPASGNMSSCPAVIGSVLDSLKPVVAPPTWTHLRWAETAPVLPSLGKQFKVGVRLLLKPLSADGHEVDALYVASVQEKS